MIQLNCQRRHLNDRQRTILGLVTVFSLVGIALLSLAIMDQTSNSVTVLGSGQEATIVSQIEIPSVTEDPTIDVSFNNNNELIVKATEPAPAASVKFACGRGALSVDDKPITSTSGVVSAGALNPGDEKKFRVSGCEGTVAVSVSSNGFAYSEPVSPTQ